MCHCSAVPKSSFLIWVLVMKVGDTFDGREMLVSPHDF